MVASHMMASIALPTGPYDWHPERIPRGVYEARGEQARMAMRQRGVTNMIVHGNGFDHGGLAWLTGFTPKLGPGYALIPVEGASRLLFAGGSGMRPSAARLTWIEDVAALKGIAADLGQWLGEGTSSRAPVLGLCEGRAMALDDWQAATRAVPGHRQLVELDDAIDGLRRAKTPIEIALIRRAAAILGSATDELAAASLVHGVRTAALAAERLAYDAGAQDIRVRIGTRPWAAPIALGTGDHRIDGPVRVAVAVRYAGYWVHGHFVAGVLPAEAVRRARDTIADHLGCLRPGATAADLAAGLGTAMGTAMGTETRCTVTGVGLSPAEHPFLTDGDELRAGDVCVLTLSCEAGRGQRGQWSAIVAIDVGGHELLWTPPGLSP